MGRKLTRFKPEHISIELIGKEADIILQTKEVFHGLITKVENQEVVLKSFHSHILNFEIKKINEIIISE